MPVIHVYYYQRLGLKLSSKHSNIPKIFTVSKYFIIFNRVFILYSISNILKIFEIKATLPIWNFYRMFKTTRTRLNTSLQAFYSSMLSFSLFLQLLLSSPSPFISRSCYPYLHFPTLARCFVPLFRRFLLPSLTATLPNTGVHSWCWHPFSLLYRPYSVPFPCFGPRRGTFRPPLRGFKARSVSMFSIFFIDFV